jgi:dephospho-CoA kinase
MLFDRIRTEEKNVMFAGKPIIGIAGGIGSGKSFIASLFGEFGCLVFSADEQVDQAYQDPAVRQTIRQWWGPAVFLPNGQLDRAAVAARVFSDEAERRRLEGLIHPRVNQAREQAMAAAASDPRILAFVWDIPLLFEVDLARNCDAIVFVEASPDLRLQRVQASRGWDSHELEKRENLQWPLDRKRKIADHIIWNTADAGQARAQVRDVLSKILVKVKEPPLHQAGP